MKRTVLTGLVAFALTGASFGQAGTRGNQDKTQNPQDPTAFQKGHADPSDQTKTDPAKKQKQKNKKTTDPTKTGKQNKGPIDPNPTDSTTPKGKGSTVPAPTPAPTK